MKIYWDLTSVQKTQNSVITVGTFDGVHLGHQHIIDELKTRARFLGAQTTLVTFDTHPQIVLSSPDKPALKILTTIEEKLAILEKLDIDRVVVIKFSKEFANTNPHEFIKNILFEQVGFTEIVVGYDHAFGKNREGDIETLVNWSNELGFSVNELSPFMLSETRVSSSKIRETIQTGNIKQAEQLLGRNYPLSGKVVKGDGRGKDLNFPTANIEPKSKHKLVPPDGVYAVYVRLGSRKFKGMMNIGHRPTFSATQHALEVHIFDFNDEIYGEDLTIEFEDRIREEIKFSRPNELIKQLRKDKEHSLQIL
ncbi:bifunctional riboflavin kinase/FAD synthetase [candidate division KSB1 bacterium]|nr:bifunctional riboflavin kinase/FAD synthetase [candidate division KSB1 bacterium]NIR70416.1 bifunctional riboflavin kinase/FAD synthetase [candidate division KSB1 bacterium]NIS25956.1 bifunctional riboflavin kinase/FAD synthetase [candidate division KSB1 bacterium]NIT69979.1 bifunctional riboflavin kinase/FAD synthetase [candidate division KSB1 bacterium]NIU26644.1 bifunctional riboflavin kinase/FAD synthetase [candidate division KSB1 bacterium]